MYRKIALPFILIILLACSAAYFPPYDAGFYADVETLRDQTMSFIDSGAKDAEFFESAYRSTGLLREQAEQYEHNEQTEKMLGYLEANLGILEEILPKADATSLLVMRSTLLSQFEAILALEDAKERRVR